MDTRDVSRVVWRKSTRTGGANGTGGNCVEVGALPKTPRVMWRKSSRSGPASGNGGGNCVEVGTLLGEVGVRDSKLGNASTPLWVAPTDWAALLDTVRTDA